MKNWKYVLSTLMVLCTISCTTKEKSNEVLKEYLEGRYNTMYKEDVPGISVKVLHKDAVLFEGNYGLADLQTKEKITAHTIFNTGSISKTFVAYGILILQEEGKLSIEDTIGTYFPDFKNKKISSTVKIKHLLSHTSGLPDLREVRRDSVFYLTAKDTANFAPIKQADSLLFEPGSNFRYSNPSFNGLALIIEKVSQKPWQAFIKERILIPSGMRETKITNGAYPSQGVAHAYILNAKEGFQEYDYGEFSTFAASGNGGVWCSLVDLIKYEKAIQNHVFLNKASIDLSRSVFKPVHWNGEKNPKLGFSWFLKLKENSPKVNNNLIYHTGSQGGFNAYYFYFPEKEIYLMALSNKIDDVMWNLLDETIETLKKEKYLD